MENYAPGRPENKPIILADIKKAEEKREKQLKEIAERKKIIDSLKNKHENDNQTISQIKKSYEKKIEDKNHLITELLKKVRMLTEENNLLKNKLEEMT